MLVSVFISYFKTFKGNKYIPLSQGERFSALIGENGAGKSSILESLNCLFNRAEWNINNQGKRSGSPAHVVGIFLIRKDSFQKIKKDHLVKKKYEVVDDYLRNISPDKFNTSQRQIVEDFIRHRDEVLSNLENDNFYLAVAGKQSEMDDSFFTVFDKDISKLIDTQIRKDNKDEKSLEKAVRKDRNLYSEDVLSKLAYIYIPAEVNAAEFTRLESTGIQKLMGKELSVKIAEHFPPPLIAEINKGLHTFLDEIEGMLDGYRYKRLPGKDGYLTKEDVREKVVEAFFATRVLNKISDQGDIEVKNLSSGEKRKSLVDLASSFIEQDAVRAKSVIIAFDEPEASLDVGSCFEQYQKIQRMAKEGSQIMVATHWYGFMPIVSIGNAIHLERDDMITTSIIPLYNYKESIKHRNQKDRVIPKSIDLKSMNDLVQSIYHSIKSEDFFNWIICEGSTDKVYIENYIDDERLKVIPLGGANQVKKLFEYMFIAINDIDRELKNKGKVLCVVDTDDVMTNFSSDGCNNLSAMRLLCIDKHVDLVRVTDKRASPVTVIEDALEGHVFLKTLKEFRSQYEEIDNLLHEMDVDDLSYSSCQAFDLKKSQFKVLKDFFSKDDNKMRFANKYAGHISKTKPVWISKIMDYFDMQEAEVSEPMNENVGGRINGTLTLSKG
ncbi:AAA family ATPase [Neptuniibacter sp. QD37_6]|uniref:AAA family ATPase n=1 Tax=Neptuniibacter sp. QD37_6 TaxID=3398210 RepID=UPI0039F4843D